MESIQQNEISREFNDKQQKVYQSVYTKIQGSKLLGELPTERQYFFMDSKQIARFSIAREFKEEKVYEMWENWVRWWQSFNPDKIDDKSIENCLKSGKAFFFKNDKNGYPTLYVFTRRHIPGQASMEEELRFGVYLVEKGAQLAEQNGVEKINIIYDRTGFTSKNFDKKILTIMQNIAKTLSEYYAERLNAFYVLQANWFFRTVFSVVKKFMSKRTSDKIIVLKNNQDLMQFYNADCLLKQHGGTQDYQYQYAGVKINDDALAYQSNNDDDDQDLQEIGKEVAVENNLEENDYINLSNKK